MRDIQNKHRGGSCSQKQKPQTRATLWKHGVETLHEYKVNDYLSTAIPKMRLASHHPFEGWVNNRQGAITQVCYCWPTSRTEVSAQTESNAVRQSDRED